MDIQATLLDIADEIERGMSADGATSAAWRQSAFARDAGGAPVPPDADDAVGWCVFGHIRRRETDSILTRDCYATALVLGLPHDLTRRVNAMEDASSWEGAPFVSILRGFAVRVERAAVGKTGDFRQGDYLASIMEALNDSDGLRAADVVAWLRHAAERYGERRADLGEPAQGSPLALVAG